jgi:hypothetical protein
VAVVNGDTRPTENPIHDNVLGAQLATGVPDSPNPDGVPDMNASQVVVDQAEMRGISKNLVDRSATVHDHNVEALSVPDYEALSVDSFHATDRDVRVYPFRPEIRVSGSTARYQFR